MTQLNGWIISNGHLNSAKFTDYVTWFCQTAEQVHVPIKHLRNDQLLVTSGSDKPMLCTHSDGELALPDFVHFADKDLHLARQLEFVGVPVFNSSCGIAVSDNKCLMHGVFNRKDIPVPETIIAPMIYSGMALEKTAFLTTIEEKLGFPLIVKEAYGSFGQQVYWIDTRDELHQTAYRLAGKEHLYQKPVFSSIGTDIRLNVVGNEVEAAMKRTSQTDFRANVTAGGQTEKYSPSRAEQHLAIAAAKACNTDFAGVDLLLGEDGPVVCEVNSNPHIRSVYDCTGINLARPMINYIKQKLLVT